MFESVSQALLTLFLSVITPIPWWLALFHSVVRQKSKTVTTVCYFSIFGVIIVLAWWAFGHQDLFFGSRFTPTIVTRALGVLLFVSAFVVDRSVMKMLGLKRLAMIPEFHQEKGDQTFVATGIYRYSRHPRYVEYMLIALSTGLFFGYLFMFGYFIYLVLAFWVATNAEEAELIARFGDAYREYQKKVPRFFLV